MEGRTPRLRAISHGMNLLARQAQRRNSTTTSVRGADFAAQPYCVAEYVEPTPEVTDGHDAHAKV